MKLRSYLRHTDPSLISTDGDSVEPIDNRKLHWFSLYTFWKTLPITVGLVTLISLLPGVVALLTVIGFGLFYEEGDNLPGFLRHTVLQDLIDY